MRRPKRGFLKIFLCFCLLCCLLLGPVSSSSAAEQTYRVTEAELTELETNLTKLQTLAQRSRNESDEQKRQLAVLKRELNETESLLERQKTSLETANELLKESAAAEKKARDKLHRERSIGLAIIGALLLHHWMD